MAALGSDVPGYVPGGRNVMADQYAVSPGNPSFPDKAHFIGLLAGNWWQMGCEGGGLTME